MTKPNTMRRYRYARLAATVISLIVVGPAAWAGGAAFPVLDIDFDVDSLSFSGTALMPLGSDFAPVATDILFTATGGSGNTFANGPDPVVQNNDQLFFENSTMSLVFDITLTDVDPVNNFAGGASALSLNGVQFDMGDVVFIPNCVVADASDPFFGCGMLLSDNFSEGDTAAADVGPTVEGGDYDSLTVSVPIPLGQDADGLNGIDVISATTLELAFTGPTSSVSALGVITQTYEVDVLWSGSINPDFGDPVPLVLSGGGTFSEASGPTPVPSLSDVSILALSATMLVLGVFTIRRLLNA